MADDTQKSIFDAFSGTQTTSGIAPQTTQTPPPPSAPTGEGGSIFSAFSAEQSKPSGIFAEAPKASFETQQPKESGSIFGAFSPESEPQQHQPLQDKSDPVDENAPWYKKLWQEANAPLFDAGTAKKMFGWDVDHWNGWGKGLFDLASGLTSPLQIALTIGTFGSGAVFESAGAAALKGIMSAEEIAQVTRGSEILTKALKIGAKTDTAYAAMADLGVDPMIVKNGLEQIAKAGLNPEAMMANGLIRRTGGAMLRGAGVDVGKADLAANIAQFAVDAGFTAQNAYGAVIAAPQVLDAIKEGDYETAKRLAVDALGSGAFALLGGRQIHNQAGELMTNGEASIGLRVKPSDENLKLIRLLEPMEGERVAAGEKEKNWVETTRKQFKDITPEGDLRARFFRESEGDLQKWHDEIEKSDSVKNKDLLLRATDPKLLTDREKEYAKHVGLHFDETGTQAVLDGVLGHLWDQYVTRIWKDPENDTVRKFRTIAATPDFSVNSQMARKRVFESTLEGLLKGYELKDHDMISLAAHNGNEFANVASARRALIRLRGAGARVSDGRPMLAVSGSGHLIESYDEEGNPVNPATIIYPKGMQGIRMANKVVEGLKKNIVQAGETREAGEYKLSMPTDQKSMYEREGKQVQVRDILKGDQKIGEIHTSKEGDTINVEWIGPPEAAMDKPMADLMNTLKTKGVRDLLYQLGDQEPGAKWVSGERITGMSSKNLDTRITKVPLKRPPLKGEVTELDKLIKQGKIAYLGQDKKGRDMYAWTAHDYKTIKNPAFQGVKMPTVDTDGNPIFVMGELKAHPEVEEYLNRRFGVEEGLTRKVPGLTKALGAAREAKGMLLAFSPFHIMQEGLRAIMTGISPFTMERFDPANDMHRLAAEKGVWELKDYRGVKSYEDGLIGHSKLISKIPGLREIQSWSQEFLFDKYIPALKLRAFQRMYEANKSLHSEWTKEKLANESADEVNERFGGIPYKRIGRSAAVMDLARLTTLAPDWLESEMRFMKRVLVSGEEGAVARRDVLKMTLGLWAAARVMNYLVSGKLHNEAPLGVAYKDEDGREKIYSVRTMPGDMLHAVQDPLGFLNGRVAPLLKTGIQTYTGRDEFGRKMDRNGMFVNLIRNVAPIGAQTAIKKVTGQDTQGITTPDQIAKAAGFTVYPYRTEAQKEAAKLASDHVETGSVSPDKLRRHQGMLELETRVREGKVPLSDVYKAVESGQIHVDEARKMVKTLQETAGMDEDTARLYIHATRLPMADFLNVWDKATNDEKMFLSKLFLKKKTEYLKKALKEMSPGERQSDTTYQRLRKMFPTEAPWGGPSGASNSAGRFPGSGE